MTSLLRYTLTILALISISGCAAFVKAPLVTVHSINIISADTAGVNIELVADVKNPNTFDVSLLGYTYDLQIMSVPFASGGLQKAVEFPSGQLIDIRLPFRVHFSDLLGVIKRCPDLDRVPYSLDATLNFSTPFGEIIIPLKKNDSVSVPTAYRPNTYFKRILQPFKGML